MKSALVSLHLLLACTALACAGHTPDAAATADTTTSSSVTAAAAKPDTTLPEPERGRVLTRVQCLGDAAQSYALYIPRQAKTDAPVVYCFDSHGDGALPVSKYHALADSLGCILVGSNNSKNGNDWPMAAHTWQVLMADTKVRLHLQAARLYTCGFSGGAKVAGYVALNFPGITGVIANGAGLPDQTAPGNFPFSFTALAGRGDMNMTDLVAFDEALNGTATRHRLILFDGKHEWAPEAAMQLAFATIVLDDIRHSNTPRDPHFPERLAAAGKQQIEALCKAGHWLKAMQVCRVYLSLLDGLPGLTWFQDKATALSANQQYRQQVQADNVLLTKEQGIKDTYMQHLQRPEPDYWVATIAQVQQAAKQNGPEKPMQQRLLAYLSLVFYSLGNRCIAQNDNAGGRYFTDLYKLADPDNTEAWYFSAILYARSGNAAAAESELAQAVKKGFNDKARMQQQPEFRQLTHLPAL